MAFIVLQTLTGLASASSLFLVAAGLTVIFGVTRVVNFAHGSLFMLGAYLGHTILGLLPRDPASFALGVVATSLGLSVFGALLEMVLLRRVYRSPELFQLLATFGLVLILQDVTLAIWGPNDLSLPRPLWLRASVAIGDQRFPVYGLVLIAIGPLVLGALSLVLRHTRWGTLVRAATQDREMVAALGVNPRGLFTTTFALGAALAGLGGVLTLPDQSANLQMDLSAITDAFVVVVIGGMGSIAGAYLASVMIGLLQAFGIVLFPSSTLVMVFLLMAAVLVLRPTGLLGRAGAEPRDAARAIAVIRPAPFGLRVAGWAVLLAAAAAPFLVGPYALTVLTEALIAMLFAASLHLLMGPGGMPSFGHAAWFGIGAYAAGLLAGGIGMAPAMVAAPVAAGLAAAAFGWFVIRLSGVYLAMLTLAFAQIIWAIAVQWTGVTGGDDGILGLWPAGWARSPAAFYWLALLLCAGGTLALRHALYAPFGYGLRAARDSEARAEAIGLPSAALRVAAFAIAGATAGLSGALFAFAKGSVFPTYVSIGRSVDALVMVLIGGVETVAGPILGALAYTGLYDGLLRFTGLWRLALGVVILVLVVTLPDGIAGTARKLWLRGREA